MKTRICTDCINIFRPGFEIRDGSWICPHCQNENEINYRAEEAEAEIERLKLELKVNKQRIKLAISQLRQNGKPT